MRLVLLTAAALLQGVGPAVAQVIPDRATATTATQGAAGRITVGIAPANPSGISHNTYTEFSVPREGVGLNNRGVDASTIVNEVTSTRRSFINGPVEVLGSRAHVVLANPNGITVNGAQFINTGGVALAAGPVRYGAAGAGLVNTVLSTGNGDITVTGGGLSGAMTTLQLIAGRLKIDGPVANTHIGPSADIALVAGHAEVTLDSTVSPLTTLRPLTKRRDLHGASDEILVDITPKGSLSASRIGVSVNSRGAGVSFAGRGQAAIGDFTISANGKVTTRGAVLKAETGLKIAAGSIEVLNDARRQSKISSISKGVTLLANTGDITLHGAVTGATRSEDDPDARGGVTLKASGDIKLLTENAKRLAIAFSSGDDIHVEAGGDLVNDTGRILSNANTVVRVAGTLTNTMQTSDAASQAHVVRRPMPGLLGRWFGLKQSVVIRRFDRGTARIPGQLAFIAGKTMDIRAGRIVNSGEIDALDGSLSIATRTLKNDGLYTGTIELSKKCGLTCISHGTSTVAALGGRINAAGSAEIKASTLIDNGGDIVAYGNLSVSAPRIEARATFVPDFANRPAGLYNAFSGSLALASLTPVGGSFLAPAGRVTIDSAEPVVSFGGTINGQVATEAPAGIREERATQAGFPGGLHHVGLLRLWLE
ncbi:MAG TPA: filamentous hemagglutinin N-terminal domain-containing protein [Microvirga sp.]|nr:filamentous hemagglutinin N-terminal domain-containing protein [Microvirga sp.]